MATRRAIGSRRAAGSSATVNYYNENNAYAAQWLRNLSSAGEIAYGYVDDRDMRDVRSGELHGFTQCHFFAGIGGWPLALKLAGWPGGSPVWTGSCPCQPFSNAGKRKGEADERHLWPDFARLIGECAPSIVFGEQVASRDGREWLARVRLDLERMGYAVGAADLCAAGVAAPHIRQRLFFGAIRLADADNSFSVQGCTDQRRRDEGSAAEARAGLAGRCKPSGMGDAHGARLARPEVNKSGSIPKLATVERASAWADAIWLDCKDGKSRRVKPAVPLLVDGLPRSVAGALSGYGNAIVPQVAAQFVRSFVEAVTPCR